MTDLGASLGELFSAERAVRRTHAELLRVDHGALLQAIDEAIAQARALEREEASLRLASVAELLGDMGGPAAIDRLIDLMGESEPEPRVVAGEALQELGFSRFKEVAQGVERALARLPAGNLALSELPYMLSEIPEGGVLVLLQKFLARKDAEPVAAAIEALLEVGDAQAIGMLRALAKDTRTVSMEEVEEGGVITIGELAAEAIELLEEAGSP